VAISRRRRLTLEEFLQLPEEKPALEYEDGRVEQKASPQGKHSALHGELYRLLWAATRQGKLVHVFIELRMTFADRSYVPDLAVFMAERIPWRVDGTIGEEFLLAPDMAVEILSPGQRVSLGIRCCAWYVQNGARAALLVDGEDQSVLLFRPGIPVHVVRGDERIDLDDILPAFKLTARRLFAALRRRR
jgi:Uma2 family endonuclease